MKRNEGKMKTEAEIRQFFDDLARDFLRSGVPAEQVPERLLESIDPQRVAPRLVRASCRAHCIFVVERILGITLTRDAAQLAAEDEIRKSDDVQN